MQLLIADRLIIGDGSQVLNHAAIAINKHGKVIKVDTEAKLIQQFPQAEVSRYNGCTILPGLIDLHVHVAYPWKKQDYTKYNDELIALMASAHLREALSLGVTTVRDVAAPHGLGHTLKKAAEENFILSPRFYGVNQAICMTGGHGWALEGTIQEANGPWEVRAAVREQVKAGADWIKVMTSHRTSTPEFTQEELDAIVDESHRLGRKCCVHASLQPAIPMAIQAGFDTIEHGTFLTVEQAEQMAEKGITWVPTLVTFFRIANYYSKLIEQNDAPLKNENVSNEAKFFIESEKTYRKNFKKLMKTGVRIATGTDVVFDNYPITPVYEEIALMVELGMQPLDAIKSATQTAAEALGVGNQIGLLAPDYAADVLIIEGNPLTKMSQLRQVREVFLEGKSVYSNAHELD